MGAVYNNTNEGQENINNTKFKNVFDFDKITKITRIHKFLRTSLVVEPAYKKPATKRNQLVADSNPKTLV